MANTNVSSKMITAKLRTNVKLPLIVCNSLIVIHHLFLIVFFLIFHRFCTGQPKIRKTLSDVEVTEKETLSLEVEVYAVPEPKIVWFRDGQEVHSDTRIKIQRDSQRSETYSLTLNLIKREEAGLYEMKASNTLGTAVCKSVVTVNSEYNRNKLNKFYYSYVLVC